MKALSFARSAHAEPIRVGSVEIVVFTRLAGHIAVGDRGIYGFGKSEPTGIEVRTSAGSYTIDLDSDDDDS